MAALARAAAPAKADPRRDPRYQRVVAKLEADTRRLKHHPTARQKAAEPAKAAKGPPNEKAAGARAQQVDKLDDAKAPKPETKSFLATLQAEIAKAMPKNLGDTEKFMQGGSAAAMKGSLQGNVAQQKDASTGDMKAASKATPNEAAAPVKPVTPIAPEAAAPAPKVDGAEAMPLPKPEAEVSLQASKTEVQDQLDQEKLSETRLKKANDPRFSSVLSAQGAVAKQADSAPGQYRGKEAGVLGQAAAKAMDVARKGAGLLLGVKGGSKARVQSRQEQQKAKEELELKDFSDFVVKTFQGAKKAVDERLAALDAKVNELFDKGIEGALASMKDFVESKLLRFKLERYLGVPWGAALWLKDQFLDLPKEVDAFYEAGRKQFTDTMNALAVKVANLVEGQLAAAKKDVKDAQGQIAARQSKLSPGVQARGAQLQAEFNDKFTELESGIEDKKQQLAEGLAQKYKEAFDKADESLKALQDENKGLVTKAKEQIGEVLKALKEFKERLLGVLKKGANAVQIILDDPIQFLKYLLSAIKLGFNQFADNITTHLKAGFIKWMFGSLTKMGIEPPADLSLGSILKLVLGVLGITYARMREKAVKLLGPTAVTVIEKVVEYIQALIAGGPAALWEKVKEDLGNLKAMVIDAIQDWLITTIVKKAVAKVVSMFNPVGAIIQAILLIVDVVTFVVEKAMQLLDFVEAVVNSLYDIATGAIGTAANWIEQALGRMVPILIGFLGQLLGLGGITEKIKEFIKKIQDKVDKAIDKAIAKVVALVKKLFGKGKGDDPEKEKKLAAATQALDAVTAKYPQGATEKEPVMADAAAVRASHPVLTSLTVVQHEEGFDYEYTASPRTKKPGPVFGENWTVAPHIAKAPPANTGAGESHHVPAKVLKQWFAEVLESAADNLPGMGHLRALAATYRADPEGSGLSAIWLSAKDHKTAHKPAKPGDLPLIQAEIKGVALEIKTATDNYSAKPLQATVTRSAYAHEVGGKAATSEKRLREIVQQKRSKLGGLFRNVFDSLLGAGIAFVSRAKLKKGKSKRDWKSALRSLADSTWSKYFKVPKS